MYELNLKEGQDSIIRLNNGIRVSLKGGKYYEQYLLKMIFDQGHTEIVNAPNKEIKEEPKDNKKKTSIKKDD